MTVEMVDEIKSGNVDSIEDLQYYHVKDFYSDPYREVEKFVNGRK